MMSKTFSNKNSTLGLFLFTLRQNLGLIILSVIGMLLVCPGYVLIELNEYYDRLSKEFYELNNVLLTFGIAACIVGAIGVVVYNIINFMYLYSKKSSDVFHAVPLTRTELLLSRSLAGLVSTLIPLIIGYISLALIAVFTPWIIADLEILAILFMYNIFIMLIAFSLSLVFLVCAGSVFDFALSIGIINIGLLLLPHIISVFAEEFLFGYTYSVVENIMKCFSPIYYYIFTVADFTNRASTYERGYSLTRPPLFNSNEITAIIVTVVLVALFIGAAILLYKRRNAEKAGTAYAFKFIYVISNLLLSFEVGFGVGVIFSDLNLASPAFWIFTVAGALIASVAFGAISERGFKEYKKSLIVGGVSAAAVLLLTTCYALDITGFETRIPQNDKILTVEANIQGFTVELTGDDVKYVTNLHKKITEEYDIAHHEMQQKDKDYHISHANLIYKMKNGTTIKRSYYSFPTEYFAEDMLKVCKFEDVDSVITQVKAEKPKTAQLSGHIGEGAYFEYSITRDDFINLLEVYNRANDKMDKSIFTRNSNLYIGWESEFYGGSDHIDGYFDFCVGDNYTEFFEVIEEIMEKYQNLVDEDYGKYED